MKKIIIFLLITIPIISFTQTSDREWDYSEYWQKSKSWTNQTSYQEKLNECQIPEKLLKEMSTESLVKTCLNFPFLLDVYAFDNIQDGFDRITSKFNGFKELYSRGGAATAILGHYKKIKNEHINKPDLLDEKYKAMPGKFVIELDNLELLLAQNEIIQKLAKSEKLALAKECIQKHDQKCHNTQLYGIDNIQSTVLILGRLLQIENEYVIKDNNLNSDEFIKKGKFTKIGCFTEIMKNARNYISK